MRFWTFLMSGAFGLALSGACFTQSNDDWHRAYQDCLSRNPEVTIAGCSRMLAGGSSAAGRYMAYINRARAYARKSNFNKSREDTENALRLNPSSAEAYVQRSTLFEAEGDIVHAFADANKAVALDPASTLARNWLESLRVRARQQPSSSPGPDTSQNDAATKSSPSAAAGAISEKRPKTQTALVEPEGSGQPTSNKAARDFQQVTYSNWTKFCTQWDERIYGPQECLTTINASSTGGSRRIAAITLVQRGNDPDRLVIVVHAQLQTPDGMAVGIDRLTPLFVRCRTSQSSKSSDKVDAECSGEFPFWDAGEKLKTGRAFKVEAVTEQGEKISLSFPLAGFATAPVSTE